MKTLIIWIVMVAATVQSSTAQINENEEDKTKYGFAISQFKSGSGFQPGVEAHFTIQSNVKSKMSFGMFIDNESKKFSGITITHQRMLIVKREKLPTIQPYIFYNFIYRKTTIPALDRSDANVYLDLATYASMEHHLGIGFSINILKNIVFNNGLGYGVYLGSIKRPSAPDPITGEISGTSGTTLIFKTGLGFQF